MWLMALRVLQNSVRESIGWYFPEPQSICGFEHTKRRRPTWVCLAEEELYREEERIMNICDCVSHANTDTLCQLSNGDQCYRSWAVLQEHSSSERLCRPCSFLTVEDEKLASCCQPANLSSLRPSHSGYQRHIEMGVEIAASTSVMRAFTLLCKESHTPHVDTFCVLEKDKRDPCLFPPQSLPLGCYDPIITTTDKFRIAHANRGECRKHRRDKTKSGFKYFWSSFSSNTSTSQAANADAILMPRAPPLSAPQRLKNIWFLCFVVWDVVSLCSPG